MVGRRRRNRGPAILITPVALNPGTVLQTTRGSYRGLFPSGEPGPSREGGSDRPGKDGEGRSGSPGVRKVMQHEDLPELLG